MHCYNECTNKIPLSVTKLQHNTQTDFELQMLLVILNCPSIIDSESAAPTNLTDQNSGKPSSNKELTCCKGCCSLSQKIRFEWFSLPNLNILKLVFSSCYLRKPTSEYLNKQQQQQFTLETVFLQLQGLFPTISALNHF